MNRYVAWGLIAVGFAGFLALTQLLITPTLPGQSAAPASIVLNEGQQIAAAWNEYLKDHQNNPPTTSGDLISPDTYVSEIPKYPTFDSDPLEMVISKNNGHYFAYADMGSPHNKSVAATAADPHAVYCDRIIKTAILHKGAEKTGPGITGNGIMTTAAPGTIYNSNGAAIATSGNGTFGCAYTNATTGNTVGGMPIPGGHYVMEYLLQ